MKSNAAGQLLGYSLQFPRAFFHLLKSGPGDTVSIEVLGDVARKIGSGEVISEEDKSSLFGKAITDKSTDLWKTFFNWIGSVINGDLDVNKTKFLLYTNKSGKHSIVDQFSDAKNPVDAKEALEKAKTKLSIITTEHEIWKYFDFVVNQNESLLLKIIPRFEVQYGSNTGYEEIDEEIKKKHVPANHIDFLRDKISTWVTRITLERIAKKEPTWITWEDFDKEFLVVFERVRRRELIDFALESPPKSEDIQSHLSIRPCYIRQLDVVGCSDEDIVEAVSHYLRADVNLHKWIENEIIDEDIAQAFSDELKGFWSTQRKRIEITEKKLSDVEKGQLLLGDCKSRQVNVRGETPPYPTIPGAYHSLANEPALGWHPEWEKLFPSREEE
jgi:hypothetical protein